MTTLDYARLYLRAGLAVLPVKGDGSKRPALGAWKRYQEQLPTEDDLLRWFAPGERLGVGIVCGRVSGCLEVLDFECEAAYRSWAARIERERPDMLPMLPRVKTPSGGRHVYLFHPDWSPRQGTRPLARSRTGELLIEVRGEGAYVVAPGSPAACHQSGRLYEWEIPLAVLAKGA